MQSHPAQGHTSYPPDLCPFDPLGSHCYLATIPPTGGQPPPQPPGITGVLFKSFTLGTSAALTNPSVNYQIALLLGKMAVSQRAAGMGLLLNKK